MYKQGGALNNMQGLICRKIKLTNQPFIKMTECGLHHSHCCILDFDQAQNAIQCDASEGRDTFQWPVIERDRVGGFG